MYSIHVSMEERLKIPTALRTRGHFDDPLELNRHLDALMAVDYSASGSGLNSCSKVALIISLFCSMLRCQGIKVERGLKF